MELCYPHFRKCDFVQISFSKKFEAIQRRTDVIPWISTFRCLIFESQTEICLKQIYLPVEYFIAIETTLFRSQSTLGKFNLSIAEPKNIIKHFSVFQRKVQTNYVLQLLILEKRLSYRQDGSERIFRKGLADNQNANLIKI